MNVRDRAPPCGASHTSGLVEPSFFRCPGHEKVPLAMTITIPSQLPTASILWFEDSAAADPRRVGGKAAALAGLADRLPVPPGFVVVGAVDPATVELAYAELADRAGTGEPLVAVRSSATDEDGLQASFAGQHETILGVRGMDELLAAIAACRASGNTDRALQYRRANGLAAPSAPLPVLVQLLVAADAAAVVFSVDPVAPARGEVLVNAAFGLGESIVGGTVTPDEWALARPTLEITRESIADKRCMTVRAPGGSREIDVPAFLRRQPSITHEQAREAAALALRLEDELGLPVDLELAWSANDLHLLQCRPITTLAQEAA
jgi:pyruvate,water dikinase